MEARIFTIIGIIFAICIALIVIKRTRRVGIGALVAAVLGVGGFFAYIAINGTTWLINPGPPTQGQTATEAGLTITTVASGIESPWGIAFLPDGRFLVTERDSGKVRIIGADGKALGDVSGVPAVYSSGQGGMLDIALHPGFASNGLVYLTYAEGDANLNGTAVARGVLTGNTLTNVSVIFRQAPKVKSSNHYGSRLLFTPSPNPAHPYYLFITLGERYDFKERAQTPDNHLGKLIRLYDDGSVPADNPFVGKPGALGEIWSIGHRNMQGITTAADGSVLTIEHGPQGGDELNAPLPGRNYGWPVITWGEDYGGGKIGEGITSKDGLEQPLHYWVPSIAPSGMVRLTSDIYPGWKNNLFVTSLAHMQLVRIEMEGNRFVAEHRLLGDLEERLRAVAQGPDGKLYVLTDSPDGRILRLDPK
jgi:aldose sugar dehydrogenase